jgi:hypothetical protein
MKTAILHYSVPPVVGGVETVIQAHTSLMLGAGYPVTLVAGAGDKAALRRCKFITSEMIQNPLIIHASQQLETGHVRMISKLTASLEISASCPSRVITSSSQHIHQAFNLPLTALMRLLDMSAFKHIIAWCHDFT